MPKEAGGTHSEKKAMYRNYLFIVAVCLATIALSTFCIRTLYMSLHMKEVTKEAKGVAEYTKSRFAAYEALDLLVEQWNGAKMNESRPSDEQADFFHSNHESLLHTDVTEEEVREMDAGMLMAYTHSNYAKLSSGIDLIYQTFDVEALYCVNYTREGTRVLFRGDDDNENMYRLPDGDLPADLESYDELLRDSDIMNGDGRMTTLTSADGSEKLRYTLRITSTENNLFVVIWERDGSAVSREIDSGALKISLFTALLLMTVFIIILLMYRKNHLDLLRTSIEKERSRAELDICRRIQLSQLPDTDAEFGGIDGMEVSAAVRPAREVGGDFCDCFMLGSDRFVLVIADVSDKGLPAAMFMMMAKSLIRSEMQRSASPGQVIERVNSTLCAKNEVGMFVTVWLAVIDLVTGECVTVNAGHEHPALRTGGSWELLHYEHDAPVAIFDGIPYTERRSVLSDGDMLFVYTDGVTEALSAGNERFGEDRLISVLNEKDPGGMQSLIDSVFEQVDRFADGAEQYDDIGMICFRFHGKGKGKDKGE